MTDPTVYIGTETSYIGGRVDVGDALRAAAKAAVGRDDPTPGRYQVRVELCEIPTDDRPGAGR